MAQHEETIVWALQHIETCELAKRGESVILCQTEEDVESHIRPLVSEPSKWRAVEFIRGWWEKPTSMRSNKETA